MIKFEVTQDCNWLKLVHYDEDIEIRQLKLSFQRFAKNYVFHPRYKKKDAAGNRIWDGKINFFLKDAFLQVGLWGELYRVAKEYNLNIVIDGLERIIDADLTLEEFTLWANTFFKDGIGGDINKKPRPYQLEAAFNIVKFRFSTMELATNAGKTVIVFMALAFMKETGRATNALIIVPNTNLVLQGIDDFAIYGARKVGMRMQGAYSGSPDAPGDYVFGTYHSLREWDAEQLSKYETIFVDECLHPDTLIKMENGTFKKISEIVIGEFVQTINEETNLIENKEVEFVYKNLSKNNQMYEIELENGDILNITGNHKVLLKTNIWKRVDELDISDEIIFYGTDI